ncbi:MAG TPA: heme exporter protein CcmB [Bacteroidota bacterium]
MTGAWVKSTFAMFVKDLRSELRTRYALNALVLFVVVTIAIILFATSGESIPRELQSGILWVIVFFSAMSGLSRTFVSEEERGTVLTLQLVAWPSTVYFGKLLFNFILIVSVNSLVVVLYLLFMDTFVVRTVSVFLITILLGSVGIAGAATIIAAIIAKANTKGTLYPVLSFPILLPLFMGVITSTQLAVDGEPLAAATGYFVFLSSYCVVVITASYLLFDFVWKD